MRMKIIPEIEKRQAAHTEWRHMIHAHPELAYQEVKTSDLVAEKLESFGIQIERGLGTTGLVGSIRYGNSEKRIGLRADMDALPLQEKNDFNHRSQIDGVMHACGHDGHTTMLLAAAEYLAKHECFDGIVDLIFQPAEEGEAGAKAMMDDGLFDKYPVEAVYGVHNWPGLDIGKLAVRNGPMMAAMDIFEVTVRGKGGHAALPHLAADSIVIATQIVQAWQTIVSRNVKSTDAAVVSVTQIHAGDAWAVIPQEVLLRGTIRTFNPTVRTMIEHRMQEIADGICKAHQASFDWHHERRFPATVNSKAETENVIRVAETVFGKENVNPEVEPSTGSEDFGYMLEEKPGCYAFLGNGPGEGGCLLHSPHYDF
ncbi:MAG: M20 aminoacylase family protein, partial [Pseudomonadota bacterium]